MPDARIIAIQAGIAAKRPDLAAKVQTGAKGQLVLFPGHMGRTMAHAWRYAGQTRIAESVYYCLTCGLVQLCSAHGVTIFGFQWPREERKKHTVHLRRILHSEPQCEGAA